MDANAYGCILSCMDRLGAAGYGQICRVYFTALLVNASPEGGFSSPVLRKRLHIYRSVIAAAQLDEYEEVWLELCRELKNSGLDQDHRTFFDAFAPEIMQDWEGLSSCCGGRVSSMLVVMILALDVPPLEPLEMPGKAVELQYGNHKSLLRDCGVDLAAFREGWHCVHISELSDSTHFLRPAVSQAKALYNGLFLPMTDLVSDYATLYLGGSVTEEKRAMSGGRRKSRTATLSESGKSEVDQELEEVLQKLRYEKPTDVVRGLFYTDERNDAGFECSHMFRCFREMVQSDSRVLIVNPCPDFLLTWQKRQPRVSKICFVVPDETLAKLYGREFPEYSFKTRYSLPEEGNKWDRILIFVRDWDAAKAVSFLEFSSENAKAMILMSETAVTEANSPITATLQSHGLKRIVKIPNELTQSSPRKKILVHLDSQWQQPCFQLLHGYFRHKEIEWCIHKRYDAIPYGWLDGSMTVFDMRKAAQNRNPNPQKTQKEAKVFCFSPEIRFRYLINADCKNRVAGRVYYSAILRPEDKHRKQGKRLTPIVEKGLRQESEAQVVAALETAVLDERIAPFAAADVLDFYDGRYAELSLKTLWYCLHGQLLTLGSYREEVAVALFCGQDQTLGSLCIGTARGEDYEAALQDMLGDSLRKKHWEQLNIILRTAKKQGLIARNEVDSYLAVAQTRLDKRQREVRNALTKKTLEPYEIHRMMDFLCEKVGDDQQIRFIKDSRWLIPLIRLFTGMRISEVCALRWMDFMPIGNLDTYQFAVRSYLDHKDSIRVIVDHTDGQYRSIPVAPALAEMLLEYKHFLLQSGQNEELLELCFIVARISAGDKPCGRKVGTAACAELVEKAQIPSHMVLLPGQEGVYATDLGRYGGDIFYTNFKFYLRHYCSFTEGEVRYLLGLKPKDTFSAHYCDFGSDILQHKMAIKLSRWTAEYGLHPMSAVPIHSQEIFQNDWEKCLCGSAEAPVSATIYILPQNGVFSQELTIEVESRFGFDATITCFTEDQNG